MRTLARFLLLAALVIWVGGIIFFSFVVAPVVFSTLHAQSAAGTIVSRSLGALHYVGLVCGLVFLACTFAVELRRAQPLRAAVALMFLCTAFSQFGVTPQMQRIREAVGGSVQALPPRDAGRAAFDRLHQTSVVLEGMTLVGGIAALVLLAREKPEGIG